MELKVKPPLNKNNECYEMLTQCGTAKEDNIVTKCGEQHQDGTMCDQAEPMINVTRGEKVTECGQAKPDEIVSECGTEQMTECGQAEQEISESCESELESGEKLPECGQAQTNIVTECGEHISSEFQTKELIQLCKSEPDVLGDHELLHLDCEYGGVAIDEDELVSGVKQCDQLVSENDLTVMGEAIPGEGKTCDSQIRVSSDGGGGEMRGVACAGGGGELTVALRL